MSIHITSLTASQLTERSRKLAAESADLAKLAAQMARYEKAYGCTLFLSEAAPGTSYVGTPEVVTPEEVFGKLVDVVGAKPASGQPSTAEVPVSHTEAPKGGNPRPAARSEAPAAMPEPELKRDERPWGALSLAARRIVKHIEKLPKTFTPAEDLTLVEMLVTGSKIEQVAALLEASREDALDRWRSFLTEDVLGENGKPSIDGQSQLLAALRYRKETANG